MAVDQTKAPWLVYAYRSRGDLIGSISGVVSHGIGPHGVMVRIIPPPSAANTLAPTGTFEEEPNLGGQGGRAVCFGVGLKNRWYGAWHDALLVLDDKKGPCASDVSIGVFRALEGCAGSDMVAHEGNPARRLPCETEAGDMLCLKRTYLH